jgi:hypothetical protein
MNELSIGFAAAARAASPALWRTEVQATAMRLDLAEQLLAREIEADGPNLAQAEANYDLALGGFHAALEQATGLSAVAIADRLEHRPARPVTPSGVCSGPVRHLKVDELDPDSPPITRTEALVGIAVVALLICLVVFL